MPFFTILVRACKITVILNVLCTMLFILILQELEKIGLKWSVLSTVSWDDMYESLCAYSNEKRAADPQGQWDGNVPANHKTSDDPPRSLGRWVNRQRCSFAKKKLKADLLSKLEAIGLKWCVHEKKSVKRAIIPATLPDRGKIEGKTPNAGEATTPLSGNIERKTPNVEAKNQSLG